MPRLKTLKPRLVEINPFSRVKMLPSSKSNGGGSAGVRWVGRKLTEWRRSIFMHEPLCRHCDAKGLVRLAEEVDHIIPLEQGGTYDRENVQPLCKPCHKAKTAADRGYKTKPHFGADGWPVNE